MTNRDDDDNLPKGYYSEEISDDDFENLLTVELLDRVAEIDRKKRGKEGEK